jgi:hypothetical protein
MGRIEKTVFISYRRRDEPWALAVFGDLTQHGYDVFVDYDGIASGKFETVIFENIRARAHFLVLLTPTALEPRSGPVDWMRREIEAAIETRRNIVPVMLEGFDFGAPAVAGQLTGKLAALKEYNGLEIPKGYFSPAMERLRNKFLNVPVDAVLHEASDSAQQAATEQKDKAARALRFTLGIRTVVAAAAVTCTALLVTWYIVVASSQPPLAQPPLALTTLYSFPAYRGDGGNSQAAQFRSTSRQSSLAAPA